MMPLRPAIDLADLVLVLARGFDDTAGGSIDDGGHPAGLGVEGVFFRPCGLSWSPRMFSFCFKKATLRLKMALVLFHILRGHTRLHACALAFDRPGAAAETTQSPKSSNSSRTCVALPHGIIEHGTETRMSGLGHAELAIPRRFQYKPEQSVNSRSPDESRISVSTSRISGSCSCQRSLSVTATSPFSDVGEIRRCLGTAWLNPEP